jgi:hypothetical protein
MIASFFFTLTQSTMKGNDRLKYILNKMKTFFFLLILLITYIYLDNSYRMIEISVHGLSDQLQNNNVLINSNNIILDKKTIKTVSIRIY